MSHRLDPSASSPPSQPRCQPHLQLGEVGSPIRQQLRRPALQAQDLLTLRHAELALTTLCLYLAPQDPRCCWWRSPATRHSPLAPTEPNHPQMTTHPSTL